MEVSIKKTELNNEAKKLRGIWSHHNHSHVPKLFEYLTKVPSPLKNIQHGLRRQTELTEKYFLHQDKKGEFYFHISKQKSIIDVKGDARAGHVPLQP